MEFMLLPGSTTGARGTSRWSDIHSSTLFFISPLPAQSYAQWHLLVLCIFNISVPSSGFILWAHRCTVHVVRCHSKKPQLWCLPSGGSSLCVTDLVAVPQHKLCWQFHTHELTHRSAKEKQLCNWWGPAVRLFGSVEALGAPVVFIIAPRGEHRNIALNWQTMTVNTKSVPDMPRHYWTPYATL